MNRFRLPLLLTAMILLAWAGAAGAEEHPALKVTQWSTDWQDLHTTVDNTSQQIQTGYLVVDLLVNGEPTSLAYSIAAPPNSTLEITITYPFSPVVFSVKIYEDIPDGVNEDQDPIARVDVTRH